MKTLKEYINESLLDDDILDRFDDNITIEMFNKWLNDNCPKNLLTSLNIDIKNNKIETNAGLYINPDSPLLPSDVYIRRASGLYISGPSKVLNQVEQLPEMVEQFHLYKDTEIENFEITSEDVFIDTYCKFKNLTINVPNHTTGLKLNTFDIELCNIQSANDLKEIKINGKHNITVDICYSAFSIKVIDNIKKGLKKRDTHSDDVILDLASNIMPFNFINKNWRGVNRILLKDRSRKLAHKPFLTSYDLKPGDFVLEKKQGEWKVMHKITR